MNPAGAGAVDLTRGDSTLYTSPVSTLPLLLFVLVTTGCGLASGSAVPVGTVSVSSDGAVDETQPPGGGFDHVETDNELPYEVSLGEAGMDSRPFTGPASSGFIGLGGGPRIGLFSPAGRSALTAPRDASAEDPPALRWLASQQKADGGWDEWAPADAVATHDPGLTGRVLLAFLSAGYTNRDRHDFAKVVARGLRFLKNHQGPEGWIGLERDGRIPRDLRHHAPAAAAMVEAYAQTRSPIFKGSAKRGVRALANACACGDGSLRDAPIAYGALVALVAARRIDLDYSRRGRDAPFGVRPDQFEVLAWMRVPPHRATAEDIALAVLSRHAFDDLGTDEAQSDLARLADRLTARPIDWAADGRGWGSATWPLLHMALVLTESETGDRGEAACRALLFSHQDDGSFYETLHGSWDPQRLPGCREGWTGLTARCLATLWRTK